jgi:hypothetical protein
MAPPEAGEIPSKLAPVHTAVGAAAPVLAIGPGQEQVRADL